MRYVVDASIAVEYLLRTPVGRRVEPELAAGGLLAPELLDAEVLHVLRRLAATGAVAVARASQALGDLAAWPLSRVPHAPLLHRAWAHRGHVSGYDALYVALAEERDVPLLTTDLRLARAPTGIAVTTVSVTVGS